MPRWKPLKRVRKGLRKVKVAKTVKRATRKIRGSFVARTALGLIAGGPAGAIGANVNSIRNQLKRKSYRELEKAGFTKGEAQTIKSGRKIPNHWSASKKMQQMINHAPLVAEETGQKKPVIGAKSKDLLLKLKTFASEKPLWIALPTTAIALGVYYLRNRRPRRRRR